MKTIIKTILIGIATVAILLVTTYSVYTHSLRGKYTNVATILQGNADQ